MVMPSRSQSPCGLCGVYSYVHTLELQFSIELGTPGLELSAQHIIDCLSVECWRQLWKCVPATHPGVGMVFVSPDQFYDSYGLVLKSVWPDRPDQGIDDITVRCPNCSVFSGNPSVEYYRWDSGVGVGSGVGDEADKALVVQALLLGPLASSIYTAGGYVTSCINPELDDEGHGVSIIGYKDNGQTLVVKDSWGEDHFYEFDWDDWTPCGLTTNAVRFPVLYAPAPFVGEAFCSEDWDGDGIGDLCDPDIDGDGIANINDVDPRNQFVGLDRDDDGRADEYIGSANQTSCEDWCYTLANLYSAAPGTTFNWTDCDYHCVLDNCINPISAYCSHVDQCSVTNAVDLGLCGDSDCAVIGEQCIPDRLECHRYYGNPDQANLDSEHDDIGDKCTLAVASAVTVAPAKLTVSKSGLPGAIYQSTKGNVYKVSFRAQGGTIAPSPAPPEPPAPEMFNTEIRTGVSIGAPRSGSSGPTTRIPSPSTTPPQTRRSPSPPPSR